MGEQEFMGDNFSIEFYFWNILLFVALTKNMLALHYFLPNCNCEYYVANS